MKKLVFIGCGNMGEAILRGVLAAGELAAADMAVVESLESRREFITAETGVAAVESISELAAAEAYLLAVKPQQMDIALESLAAAITDTSALVISIAAGISTEYLSCRLGANARIVRAMPNTPMLAGCGCTGICSGECMSVAGVAGVAGAGVAGVAGVGDTDMDFADRIFASAGSVSRVSEADMDAVTAVSGSGPAYFFYMIEAMAAAGVAEGLDSETALSLATKTCQGAAKLLEQTALDPAELRRRVTSPGGTTQAAIESMDSAGVQKSIEAAVRAAAARSRELGK